MVQKHRSCHFFFLLRTFITIFGAQHRGVSFRAHDVVALLLPREQLGAFGIPQLHKASCDGSAVALGCMGAASSSVTAHLLQGTNSFRNFWYNRVLFDYNSRFPTGHCILLGSLFSAEVKCFSQTSVSRLYIEVVFLNHLHSPKNILYLLWAFLGFWSFAAVLSPCAKWQSNTW